MEDRHAPRLESDESDGGKASNVVSPYAGVGYVIRSPKELPLPDFSDALQKMGPEGESSGPHFPSYPA